MNSNRLIALLCGPEARRSSIVDQLQGPMNEVAICTTSDDLYRLAVQGRIDAVVLDLVQPGFLTGLDLLARLENDLVRPVSVLIGALTPQQKEIAAHLKVNAILAPDATPEVIAEVTVGALLAKIQSLPIPYGARQVVRDAASIRPLPQLLVRAAGFLEDPNASVKVLATEIAADARITAELLKLINSSALGVGTKVSRIQDAVRLMGVKRTVGLIFSTYVLEAGRYPKVAPELEHRLRSRSLMMATVASTYASMAGGSADTAYVLAMLQDLGMILMVQEYGPRYLRILERCATVTQLQLATYEQQELGFTHADVSAALLQKWKLPPTLIRLVLQHHARSEAQAGTDQEGELIDAMQVAEAVADFKDQPTQHRYHQLHRCTTRSGKLTASELQKCLAQAMARARDMAALFSMPVPDEQEIHKLLAQFSGVPTVDRVTDDATRLSNLPESTALSKRRNVICIDDDATIREIVEVCLIDTPVNFIGAARVREVRDRLAGAAAILLDLHLDDASGIEELKRLRQRGVTVPIYILTGDRTRQAVLDAIAAGASGYILKPFDKQTLLNKLEPVLSCSAEPQSRPHHGNVILAG